jgi:hypothetical protein
MNTTTHEEHLTTADLAGIANGERRVEAVTPTSDGAHPLFPEGQANDLRTRWKDVQTGFVDEPRKAVQQADELVAQAIKSLAERFAEERNRLEQSWDRGDQVNTEDLRVALQTYRSFFQRLLSV